MPIVVVATVVPYFVSTSNHNKVQSLIILCWLFLILFLHQTTTYGVHDYLLCRCSLFCFYIKPQLTSLSTIWSCGCSLFCFYIKPQPYRGEQFANIGCSLFCFYIKPQRVPVSTAQVKVVPYFVSTSNHNSARATPSKERLFLILFLHQTTTYTPSTTPRYSCSLFCFYIKPQLVVWLISIRKRCSLFCFYIKPQLHLSYPVHRMRCSLFCFYIKPQLYLSKSAAARVCSLFCFYIKPQPYAINL